MGSVLLLISAGLIVFAGSFLAGGGRVRHLRHWLPEPAPDYTPECWKAQSKINANLSESLALLHKRLLALEQRIRTLTPAEALDEVARRPS